MGAVAWKLVTLMKQYGLRPLDIEREATRLGYPMGKNVIYRLVSEDGPQRIDRTTLTAIVAAIRSLTNSDIGVGDMLVFEEY